MSVLRDLVHLAFGVAGIALARKPILILGGSELNLARMRGGLRPTSRRRMRLGPPPAAGYATAEDSSATLLQRGWSESRQRRLVSSNDRRPPIRQSVRCYSARSDRRFVLLGVGQLLDPVRLRTLVVGFGAPCLSIVEL